MALTEQNTLLFYILLGIEECILAETRQSHLSSPIWGECIILFLHPFMPSSFPFSPTILFPNFPLLYFICSKYSLLGFHYTSPSCCSYHEITYLYHPLPNLIPMDTVHLVPSVEAA